MFVKIFKTLSAISLMFLWHELSSASGLKRNRLDNWQQSSFLTKRFSPGDYNDVTLSTNDMDLLNYAPETYVYSRALLSRVKGATISALTIALFQDRALSLWNPAYQKLFAYVALSLIQERRGHILKRLQDKSQVWDLVVVGSGPNAIATVSGFNSFFKARTGKVPAVLFLEKNRQPGLFGRFGSMFYQKAP